ncbi:hypothetical protein MJG53_018832 [Ovis ammon polii x Ovis aries]|uniref:Uncharacterized protein n=1 Tax=Ovis ammon polii x Ovis aries TaxID=2918886 RepID=A0ACB9U3A7_9CETA|nr:hypothetical protein MJG53_018832 [Ovis ammon polii x Ovis aries]
MQSEDLPVEVKFQDWTMELLNAPFYSQAVYFSTDPHIKNKTKHRQSVWSSNSAVVVVQILSHLLFSVLYGFWCKDLHLPGILKGHEKSLVEDITTLDRDAVKGNFFLILACSYSGHAAPQDESAVMLPFFSIVDSTPSTSQTHSSSTCHCPGPIPLTCASRVVYAIPATAASADANLNRLSLQGDFLTVSL